MEYSKLLELIKKRRSVRRFKSDPIPKDTVLKILDFARLSPSGANAQPWEFVIVEEKEKKKQISKIAGSMLAMAKEVDPEFYWQVCVQLHLFNAPVLVVICGDRRLQEAFPNIEIEGVRNHLFFQSMAICAFAVQLAAASFGLDSAWATIGANWAGEEIKKLLAIPDVYTIDHIIPLGYPDEEKELKSQALAPVRERASFRRELEEILHYELYDMAKFRSDGMVEEFIWNKTVTRIKHPSL